MGCVSACATAGKAVLAATSPGPSSKSHADSSVVSLCVLAGGPIAARLSFLSCRSRPLLPLPCRALPCHAAPGHAPPRPATPCFHWPNSSNSATTNRPRKPDFSGRQSPKPIRLPAMRSHASTLPRSISSSSQSSTNVQAQSSNCALVRLMRFLCTTTTALNCVVCSIPPTFRRTAPDRSGKSFLPPTYLRAPAGPPSACGRKFRCRPGLLRAGL